MSVGEFAPAAVAATHYTRRLELETDCADVHAEFAAGEPGFVLVDTRSPEAYSERHIPGAVSIPNSDLTPTRLAEFGPTAQFVTYCWGPHCNGACKGAAKIASFGFRAKEMLGGMWGWEMEGYEFDNA